MDAYHAELIERAKSAVEEIDRVHKQTHPNGTLEAQTLRELITAFRAYIAEDDLRIVLERLRTKEAELERA